jgi:hypothetical protein
MTNYIPFTAPTKRCVPIIVLVDMHPDKSKQWQTFYNLSDKFYVNLPV